jgi:predicted molibdopterin-dependent oxidoreductase YjgC
VAGLAATIGRGAMSNPLEDMEKPDLIFCIGTNMTECHPVAATRLKRALRKGARLIVADPRRINLAEKADLYLPIRVGSDVALLLAMAHVIDREGLVDRSFIKSRTEGFESLHDHLAPFTPEWASTITEVPAADITEAALLYGGASRAAIYYTLGITEHICGVDNVQSLCNLALMTGNLGRSGTGINPMRGQNNIQGAGDSGAIPTNYPGFQSVENPESRAKFEKLWGRSISEKRGMTKVTALDLAGESIHAMIIVGENTVVSDADMDHCKHALGKLKHLAVVDLFLTETAALADVVFPASGWAETDGVCTNTERRVQRLRAAVPAPGTARPDWWIICALAKKLGMKGFDFESAGEVFNELCQVSPIYNGLDWDRIDRGEYQWPVPHKDHPGTPILHIDSFVNGLGKFRVIQYRDPAETINDEFPLWLTTGRRLAAYHTRTQTGRASGIDYLLSEESLEMHPDDVIRYGLKDGEFCWLSSPRGEVLIRVQATRRSPKGTVFSSFSFSEVPINVLTGSGYDPVTQTAELKVCIVRVRPATADDLAVR